MAFLVLDFRDWYLPRTAVVASPASEFFSLPATKQIGFAWLGGLYSGFSMGLGYYLLASIAVGTGLSRPQSWPPMYGSFIKKGYTVRNIWGSCWYVRLLWACVKLTFFRHQFLRRIFETWNSLLIRGLRVKKGTLASRYLQLYNAFLISALIHHVGALNAAYNPGVKYQFMFFMIQPVAITFEDFAIYLGQKAGIKESCKCDEFDSSPEEESFD